MRPGSRFWRTPTRQQAPGADHRHEQQREQGRATALIDKPPKRTPQETNRAHRRQPALSTCRRPVCALLAQPLLGLAAPRICRSASRPRAVRSPTRGTR
jgi:hypothetical protein